MRSAAAVTIVSRVCAASSFDFLNDPLDAVIWRALTSVQESLAEGDERARRYPAAIAPFAATVDTEPASFRSLLALVGGDDQIALFTTEEVQPPSAFSVVRRASVDQMVLEDACACTAQPGAPIVALGVADGPEMLALANVTQPGPFGPRTIELGHYSGIRRHGALVAMAGERMRLDGFTEISAVCVEPAYRGHGFAAELVRSKEKLRSKLTNWRIGSETFDEISR
jgi:ribosomal protein S18 acetylase RimI-like enzyme